MFTHLRSQKVFFSFLLIGLFLLFSCSKDDKGPLGPGGGSNTRVDTISVSPTSGAPGSLIRITGYELKPTDSNVAVYVGDQPTVFLSDSSGIQALIPLFLDSASNWPQPPADRQDVTIRVNDKVVAIAVSALQVDSLPHADGATETILQDLQVIAASMRSITNTLNTSPAADPRLPGYRGAILTMLDSILVGADSSISALINGQSSWNNGQPVDLTLVDAVLASSGALTFYNEMAGSITRLNRAVSATESEGLFCREGGPDMDLACEMQIYVILDDYANYYVKPTTAAYANTVGLAAGLIAVSGVGLAGEAIVGALLTVFDFVFGTLAPSLFPAEVTMFALTVETDSIAVDELTSTKLEISAKNKPATISATTILDQLLGALGLAGASKAAESFREVLVNAIKFALDLYRKAVVQYNQDMGGTVFIDPEADLPPLSWGPVVITHSDLVELYSFTEDIITGDTAAFEWRGVSRGKGRIQARARAAGERSKVVYDNSLCIGCVYSGGAFGNNVPGSETKTVFVGKPATLDVRIVGLPDGTDADVFITKPDGFSTPVTASRVLTGLLPGEYRLTAVDVQGTDGQPYEPEPRDTTITLNEADSVTVTVTYAPKYGSLLLTVKGLPAGTVADIDITGSGFAMHVIGDTLIDSLTPGDYVINAAAIIDSATGNTRSPKPASQTVTVRRGETATAAVDYGGDVKLYWAIGTPNREDEWLPGIPYSAVMAKAYSNYSDTGRYVDDQKDLGRGRPPLLDCGDGEIYGAGRSANVSISASTQGGTASAQMIFASSGNATARVTYEGSATAAAASMENIVTHGAAWAWIDSHGYGTLVIENASAAEVALRYRYDLYVGGTGMSCYEGCGPPGASVKLGYKLVGVYPDTACSDLAPPSPGAYNIVLYESRRIPEQIQGEGDLIRIPAGATRFVAIYNRFDVTSDAETSPDGSTYAGGSRVSGSISFFVESIPPGAQ